MYLQLRPNQLQKNNPSRDARNEISSPFRSEKYQEEWQPDSRGEESKGVA
jgi:hypothetical protein